MLAAMLSGHDNKNDPAAAPSAPLKLSVPAIIGSADSASASSRVFAAHPILRRSLDALLANAGPAGFPVLPVYQQTRTGGFLDDARNPPLSFQRADRMMGNNLELGLVEPDVSVLPPKLGPDPSGFVVRVPGDLELALHRSVEAYHGLAPSQSSPFVHGFNGLPGLGPWSIAGVLRITNNKDTVLQRLNVSLQFTANMASKQLVADTGTGFVTKPLKRWRLVEAKPHELQIEKLGPRESFYASFRYQFSQVYPPAVDLIALNLNESATNTYYKLTVGAVVPKKGFFSDNTVVNLSRDIPVHLYSKPQISEALQSVTKKRVETLNARNPEFPWRLSLARNDLAPSETAVLDITVGTLAGPSTTHPEIAAVTVEIVEVIGYLRFEPKFDKSKQVFAHATQKVCERYKFGDPASGGGALPLSWSVDDDPLPDAAASRTATLRFATPPLAVTRRDAVHTPVMAKQDPQYPASYMNPDGRWHDCVITHDLRVVLHVLDEKRRTVEVEGVMAVSVIGAPREEFLRLVDAYPGLLDDAPISDAKVDLPTVSS